MAATDEPGGWRKARNDSGSCSTYPPARRSPRAVDAALAALARRPPLGARLRHGPARRVDLATGGREAIAAVPGYTRGLALDGDLAFVGLSRIRETAIFGGAPIAAYHDELKCGVGVIEFSTGTTVATLQFDNGVEEIFDVQAVPGVRCATFGGPAGDDVWLLPGRPGAE